MKKRDLVWLLVAIVVCAIVATLFFRYKSDHSDRSPAAQAKAIEETQNFHPQGLCTQSLTRAQHIKSGAITTFPSGCIPNGWVYYQ